MCFSGNNVVRIVYKQEVLWIINSNWENVPL